MSAAVGPVLVVSTDRLFAEAAAGYVEHHSGRATQVESDGVRALMVVARAQPSAVFVLGNLTRLPTDAFARRLRARWPSIRLVILGSTENSGSEELPANADGATVLEALSAPPATVPPLSMDDRSGDVELLQSLTKQEKRVLVLLGQGIEFVDIAERLSISEHTVRTHLQNLYRKLNVHSRLEIIRLVAQHGLVRAVEGETD